MEIVADASVIVKWYLIEEYRDDALRIRDDYINGKITIIAPSIMPFEVLNAIRYSRRDIDQRTLENIGRSLILYGIKLFPMNMKLMEKTVEISLKYDVTIYDAAYVALAFIRDAILYTADKKLIQKVKHEKVKHLSEYKGI